MGYTIVAGRILKIREKYSPETMCPENIPMLVNALHTLWLDAFATALDEYIETKNPSETAIRKEAQRLALQDLLPVPPPNPIEVQIREEIAIILAEQQPTEDTSNTEAITLLAISRVETKLRAGRTLILERTLAHGTIPTNARPGI